MKALCGELRGVNVAYMSVCGWYRCQCGSIALFPAVHRLFCYVLLS